MICRIRENRKGFTLVEVIVVAVIVAVLAMVGIQLYQGYVVEARQNVAENLGASACSFIQTALNVDPNWETEATFVTLTNGGSWVVSTTTPNVTFTCPNNATLTIDKTANSVVATIGTTNSDAYIYMAP